MLRSSVLVFVLASLLGSTLNQVAQSHPGGHQQEEQVDAIAARAEHITATARSVEACSKSKEYAALRKAAISRRSALLSSLRRRSLSNLNRRRDLTTVLNTDHKSNLTGLTSGADPATLFGTSVQCLLAPDVTAGPYFVSGEPIRTRLDDGQQGLPLYLDLQFVDSRTCTPVPSLYINLWHANATGVYSGVSASGNGNAADTSNLYRTNHRGIYPTDDAGVVQFTTSFPGHYTGRTTHIHVSTASGGTVLPNNTYSNAVYSHVGQLFFDQALINAVELQAPYSNNRQTLLLNSQDSILSGSTANSFDPVVTYAYVNDDIANGILAWASIAVDTSQIVSVNAAVFYSGNNTVSGGSQTTNPTGPTGPNSSGSPGGNGGAPPQNSNPPARSPTATPSPSPSSSATANAATGTAEALIDSGNDIETSGTSLSSKVNLATVGVAAFLFGFFFN